MKICANEHASIVFDEGKTTCPCCLQVRLTAEARTELVDVTQQRDSLLAKQRPVTGMVRRRAS